MHMTFWWGDDLGDFFIKGFKIDSSRSMVVLCLCLFVLSVLVEWLKVKTMLPGFQLHWLIKLCFRCTELDRERKQRVKSQDLCHARRLKMRRFCQLLMSQPDDSKSHSLRIFSKVSKKFQSSSSTTYSITRWCYQWCCLTDTFSLRWRWERSSVTSSSDISRWRLTWRTFKPFKPKSFAQLAVLIPVSRKTLYQMFFVVTSWDFLTQISFHFL